MEEKNNTFHHGRDHDPEEPSSSSDTVSSYRGKASASLGFEEEYPSSQTLSSEAGGLEVFATDEEDNQENGLRSPPKPSDIAHENHMLPTRLDLCLKPKDKSAEEPENRDDEKAQPKSLDGVGRADSETLSVTEAGSGNDGGRVAQEKGSTQQEGRRVVAMSMQAAADLAKQIIPKVIHLLPACFHFSLCLFLFSLSFLFKRSRFFVL